MMASTETPCTSGSASSARRSSPWTVAVNEFKSVMLRLDAIAVFLEAIGDSGRLALPRADDDTLCRCVSGVGRLAAAPYRAWMVSALARRRARMIHDRERKHPTTSNATAIRAESHATSSASMGR